MIHELHIPQVQVDELWAIPGKRDELASQKRNTRWIWSATDPESKLWLGFLIADRSLEATQVFIHQIAQLLAPGCIPLFLSDRWKPYAIAILTHFGHWVDISSEYGRRRLPRWMLLPALAYAQVVKRRVRKRLVSVKYKVVYGSWHHRPHLDNGGIAYVSCSTISSASSEENSCIADSWSIALSLS